MRSFSNLWFWIALAVMWSSASHWVLGVPYDMVLRARRAQAKDEGSQHIPDMQALVQINVRRLLYIARTSGLWLTGFACFLLTLLVSLAFIYWVEFAQAVFLLVFPMTLVGLLSLNTARLLEHEAHDVDLIYKRFFRHRLIVQLIGMVSIFVTAMWGMYTNLVVGPIGA